jgi:hypothetical protein
MNERQQYPLALYLANDRRDREFRAAARERNVPSQPRFPVRRFVGQSVVRFGQRLAGEANLKPVRSR